MDMALDIISWVLIVIGGFVCISSGIGLLRLPDFFTRSHAAGLTDTTGACLILTALILQSFTTDAHWGVPVRLVMIAVFLLLTSPTACHALAQAALEDGFKPLLGNNDAASEPSAAPRSEVR